MKLWLLRPQEEIQGENPWDPWYDKAFGFVVRAETEKAARELANGDAGAEGGEIKHTVYRTGGNPWIDSALSTCVELNLAGEAEVIIRDFASA